MASSSTNQENHPRLMKKIYDILIKGNKPNNEHMLIFGFQEAGGYHPIHLLHNPTGEH